MSADLLLSRLDGVKKTGDAKWQARCPAHPDRRPSLSIAEKNDGIVLVKCWSGCSAHDVIAALGLGWQELFPKPLQSHSYPALRRPWLPSDVFEIAMMEIGVVAVIAIDMHAAKTVSEDGYARLFVAIERLSDISRAAYGKQ